MKKRVFIKPQIDVLNSIKKRYISISTYIHGTHFTVFTGILDSSVIHLNRLQTFAMEAMPVVELFEYACCRRLVH